MGNKMDEIFSFNHVSSELPEEKVEELKSLYALNHKKWFCYQKLNNSSKRPPGD